MAARPSSIPRSIEAFTDRASKSTEELDCEKRGYKLSKTTLGTGAYAKVKLAYVMAYKLDKDARLTNELSLKGHNKVAIKIISRRSAPVEYVSKFLPREIETLNATFGGPHVIRLYETFRTESRVYLVMEYAPQGDLLEFINSRSSKIPGIGENLAKHFFKQFSLGIAHCHRRNVVHRDLKCENILIDEGDIIKISDFGFATRFPTSKQQMLETFCGSYAYAAPEILQAEKYDGKLADIWSMGVILFAMLNGRLPFNDRDVRTLITQTKGKLRFSSRVQLSIECQDLTRRLLCACPSDRISVNEILQHPWLEDCDTEQPPSALTRGVPDGKSRDLFVENLKRSTIESRPGIPVDSANVNYKKAVVTTLRPGTTDSKRSKMWLLNEKEPTTMAKLLHERANKSPNIASVAEKAASEKSQWHQQVKAISPQIKNSKKISDSDNRKRMNMRFYSRRYFPDSSMPTSSCNATSNKSKKNRKEIDAEMFHGKQNDDGNITTNIWQGYEASNEPQSTTKRSPAGHKRDWRVRLPTKTSRTKYANEINIKSPKFTTGMQDSTKRTMNISVNLPPVTHHQNKNKSQCSTASSNDETTSSSIRQTAVVTRSRPERVHHAIRSKAKPILQQNKLPQTTGWVSQNQTARCTKPKVELTFYTLSGKKINHYGSMNTKREQCH